MKKVNTKIIYIILFVILSIIISFGLNYEKNKKIEQYINKEVQQTSLAYNAMYHQYKQRANLIFQTIINTKSTITIFKRTLNASDKEKENIRKELFSSLRNDYNFLKQYNIKQLHFHLPNNDSFLRFHRPKKYGDNLTDIRPTIAFVNREKKEIDGFEEGRIYNGYRFVYPLFDNGTHLGSVEISFGVYALVSEFSEHYKNTVNFLISKDIVGDVSKLILKQKPCGIYDKDNDKFVVCIPLLNPISKKTVALIMVNTKTDYIKNKILNNTIETIFSILFLSILFYIIYRELIFKNKLKENNQKLYTIIDEADSGIAIMDLKGNFFEVNHMYTELLGYSKNEFKSLNCIDLTKQDFKFIAGQILDDALEFGKVSKARKTCVAKDGSDVHLELSLNLLPDKKSFVAVINSLEDKLKIENALGRFEHIFNFTSVGFLIVDNERKIVDINKKLYQMFGYHNKDELIGQSARILHIDDTHYKDYGDKVFSKAIINKMIRVEFEFKKQNGDKFWCEVSGALMNKDTKLKNSGILWAAIDISDKVMAEQIIIKQNDKLQDLNKNLNLKVETQIQILREQDKILVQQSKMAAMGEMMDAVTHQWKQPLSIIKLSSSEISYMNAEKLLDDEYIDEVSHRIENQVDHLVETIDEFRGFFRPKTDVEKVCVKTVFDSALLLLKDEIIKNTIDVIFIGDVTIEANLIPNEFKHVLINLINNAKDEFISNNIKSRKILCELEQNDKKVIFKISDNAGGIPEEIIDDIFKANVSTKEDDKGTGIGLYMTKNIIEKIGGVIEASNIKDGACFRLELPCK